MQTKTTIRYNFSQIRIDKIIITNVGETMEKLELSYYIVGNGKTIGKFLLNLLKSFKSKKIPLYDLLLDIYLTEIKTKVYKKNFTLMFTAILFIAAKSGISQDALQ